MRRWRASSGLAVARTIGPQATASRPNIPNTSCIIRPGRDTLVGRVLLEGAITHIPDVLADPEYRFFESQRLGGFRTSLGIPLLREGTPIGVLVLARPTVRPF